MNLQRLICPMRFYLLDRVANLEAQIAQKQRRIDELQDVLIDLAKASHQTPRIIHEGIPAKPAQPRGWDDFRAAQRQQANMYANRELYNEQTKESEKQEAGVDSAGNDLSEQRDSAVGQDMQIGAGQSRCQDPRRPTLEEVKIDGVSASAYYDRQTRVKFNGI